MKAASINEIKEELQSLPPKKVLEVCMKLARFKKENKELLSYLLFESHNEQGYIDSIKLEMDEQFAEINTDNWYASKKSLRKILRSISRYTKQTGTKTSEVELLLHFCDHVLKSGIPIKRHKILTSLFEMQLKKLAKLIDLVHEDLRYDYQKQFDKLVANDNATPVFSKVVNFFKTR